MTKLQFNTLSWLTGITVTSLAIYAWGSGLDWDFEHMSLYQFFPVLGLTAFGLMWSHYTLGGISEAAGVKLEKKTLYGSVTAYLVLLLILLHPGLFDLQLYLDGYGLPPFSSEAIYPSANAQAAILIATTSLVAFLSFESYRVFKQKPWWKYIEYANIAAMYGILYHALTLGGQLMDGWYRYVWLFYALSFTLAVLYRYRRGLAKLTGQPIPN